MGLDWSERKVSPQEDRYLTDLVRSVDLQLEPSELEARLVDYRWKLRLAQEFLSMLEDPWPYDLDARDKFREFLNA